MRTQLVPRDDETGVHDVHPIPSPQGRHLALSRRGLICRQYQRWRTRQRTGERHTYAIDGSRPMMENAMPKVWAYKVSSRYHGSRLGDDIEDKKHASGDLFVPLAKRKKQALVLP